MLVSLQQRSWPRPPPKPRTARQEPCLTTPQVSRLQSACRPLLPAPPPRTASATRKDTPPSAPRARWPRWPPPRLSLLRPPWLGLSPRPGRPPSRPGRGPAYLLLSPPARQAPVPSLWSIRQVSWMVCLLGKACPQVRCLKQPSKYWLLCLLYKYYSIILLIYLHD